MGKSGTRLSRGLQKVYSEIEVVQVLRAASENLDAEVLVGYGIPYERILLIMQEMLRAGCLEDVGDRVVLTVIGGIRLQAGMEIVANRRAQKKLTEKPVYHEAQPVVDYIPPKLVG